MTQTNKALLIAASSGNFQSGPEIPTSLLATPWSAVKDQYYKQLRRQQLPSTLDWESENFSVILPRSLSVISNIYLRVNLPDLSDASHAYKHAPGKYVIQSLSFRSNGTIVYTIPDYTNWLRTYEENLNSEELQAFRETFLGAKTTSRTHQANPVFIPLALPNSRFGHYAHGGVNFGCLPCRFGNSVTEIVFTLNSANHTVLDAGHAPASIQNLCSLEFREIVGRSSFQNAFSEGRGSYSVCINENVQLNADWQNCDAGVKTLFKNISATGNLFAIEFQTQDQGDSVHQEVDVMTSLTFLEVKMDNECVISMDESEIRMDNYSHGYRFNNNVLTIQPRLQFNNQGTKASTSWRGAVDMRNIQSLDIEVAFKADCKVRLYSKRYARIVLTSGGEFKKYLD